jgi:hypothetical protein
MHTQFILGAGFSIPAGFPAASGLNERFFSNTEKKLLKFSAGEWAWDDHGETMAHNGRLNHEYLQMSYLLSEMVEAFQEEKAMPFDYEEFYDWIHRDYNAASFTHYCDRANERLKKDGVHHSHLFDNPKHNEYRRLQDCFVYLIADILNRSYDLETSISKYSGFIEKVKEGPADITTINHDRATEYILNRYEVAFSDGFTTEGSLIGNDQSERLPVFCNYYPEKVRLSKLHGSTDYHLFGELSQAKNGIYYDTGNYWFFKTNKYWDIHTARKFNPSTHEVEQAIRADITPQFLTGKSKMSVISEHLIYKQMYERLKSSIASTDRLIVIGYSYRDPHVNRLIKDALNREPFEIINVNPHTRFPFRRNYSQENILELSSIADL